MPATGRGIRWPCVPNIEASPRSQTRSLSIKATTSENRTIDYRGKRGWLPTVAPTSRPLYEASPDSDVYNETPWWESPPILARPRVSVAPKGVRSYLDACNGSGKVDRHPARRVPKTPPAEIMAPKCSRRPAVIIWSRVRAAKSSSVAPRISVRDLRFPSRLHREDGGSPRTTAPSPS